MSASTVLAVLVLREAVLALVGLAFGSFLAVAIQQMPLKRGVIAATCARCGAPLGLLDNTLLLSYLTSRRRCPRCQAGPPLRQLLVPVLTAILFSAAGLAFRDSAIATLVATFLGVVVACALIDARHRIIPNRLVYPALLAFGLTVAVLSLTGQSLSIGGAVVGLLTYGGGLLAVALVSPEGMGMGDVKLAALIGLVLGALGPRYLGVAAVTGLLAGGVGGLFALVVGRKGRKETIPFGPYLAGGAILSALAAPQISQWYVSLSR